LGNYPLDGITPGTVYVVSGSGGKTGAIEGQHALMAFQQGRLGGFEIIYINGDTLRGKFMKHEGDVIDSFTMIKKGNVTNIEMAQNAQRPMKYVLNYPNPFRPRQSNETLNIVFEISQTTPVQAAVYDLTGREVVRLSDGEALSPGRHLLQWNGRDADSAPVTAGAYFYRLQAGQQVYTAKVLLLP
jgi:hypothetical protein